MDLSLIKPVDSIRVEIDHPACEGVAFTLAGPGHSLTRQAEKERSEAIMASKRKPKGDALERLVVDYLATRTLSWEKVQWKGADLECTKENVVTVLTEGPAFLREQLAAALGDDETLYKSVRG